MNPRALAARVLVKVLDEGRSLSTALPPALEQAAPADRALLQALCYGSLRWQPRLEALLGQLLQQPLKAREREVHALLLLGLFQLLEMDLPQHAAVDTTVEAARALKKEWAVRLVNGVLRNFLRRRETLLAALEADPVAAFAHPRWLVQALREAWPDDWQRVLAANNARAPMTLRVNRRRLARTDYLARLAEAGIEAEAHPHAPDALVLATPCDVHALPGFDDGLVSVQDAAAQLAADLLDLRPGQRVLDACAAPGGKTGHMLEREAGLSEVVALDADAGRLRRVDENLQRLGLAATLLAADAGDPEAWWDGRPFDRILLDAPCSATGVIRRNPDIKALRRADDIGALASEQGRLLDALWPLLAHDGMLVYATCSVLPAENHRQVAAFLARRDDAEERPIGASWGRACVHGRQILPGAAEMDGFYYACLGRRLGGNE